MNAATLEEACSILKDIDFSSKLSNERAGYVLLALAGLKGEESWDQATDNAIRIHDIIDIINGSVFNKTYKENSRESVRKGTVAPLVAAGLVMKNPGMDDSPTNSGKTCYALTDEMLKLLRAFGTDRYNRELIRVRSVAADRADSLVPNRRVAKSHIVLPSGMTQAVTKRVKESSSRPLSRSSCRVMPLNPRSFSLVMPRVIFILIVARMLSFRRP